jgi:hypothetical protein
MTRMTADGRVMRIGSTFRVLPHPLIDDMEDIVAALSLNVTTLNIHRDLINIQRSMCGVAGSVGFGP